MRFSQRFTARGDIQDAPAGCRDLPVFLCCARMKNHVKAVLGESVEAADDRACPVCAGIALGGHHNGQRVIARPVDLNLCQPLFGAGL